MPPATGAGGLPVVRLQAADGSSTAEIYLHGATLCSWKVDGQELLWVSPKSAFEPPRAIRGGVPVCFPQFGLLGPLQAQHGFARNRAWELEADSGDAATLALASSDETLALWPHAFKLELTVSLLPGGALRQQLRVVNNGGEAFDFTCALHTYFSVSDVGAASVVGLKGLPYWDNVAGEQRRDDADAVTFGAEVDRAYIGAPPLLKVRDAGRGGGGGVLLVHKTGFADAVAWNPAEAKAASMGDLGAEHWRGFVCVEVAQARSGAVTLAPGAEWVGSTTLEYDTMGES